MAVEGRKISEATQIVKLTGEEIIPVSADGLAKAVKVKYLKGADNLSSEYVDLVADDGNTYRVKVQNGKLVAIPIEVFSKEPAVEGDNTLFDGLIINKMYGGGSAIVETPISHSFIELYNFRDEDVNLKGLYLFYRAKTGGWQSLALEGIVKSRHSFLIRCGQHNPFNSQCVRYNVTDYDMNWNIKLSDQGFSVYLCIGSETPEDNPVRQTVDAQGTVTWTNGRYIDLLGAGGSGGSDQTVWAYETRYLMCMNKDTGVHRIDFANAGTKNIGSNANAKAKANNQGDCEALNFKTCDIDIYRPRSSKDGRWTEYYDKPKQKATLPSMINIAYGENGNSTRTFTFQTPITESGVVKFRKEGEVKWSTVETQIEMASNVDGDTSLHRCIIHDLQNGKYEYQVGTDGCMSDIYSFEIKEHDQNNPIRILWTTDQQSWTKREYDVWRTCARYLNGKADNYDFHLNTGDISQNASRTFEWQYYYDYARDITRNMPHMITCGNNDLIDKKYSDAFNYYITNENKFANSVYAFDLGFTHFVSLNSNEDQTYTTGSIGGYDSTNAFLQAQADWLDAHLTEVNARPVKPRWVVIYAHLGPFTVGRTKRLQRWIAVCEKHKVDLFLCGHNHAYSRSKVIKTGYDFNVNPDYNDYVTVVTGTTDLKIVDELQADGSPINRSENVADGTLYILNQATGFKLSGKEKPLTLASLAGTEHVNADNSPWWIASQSLPSNPVYIDLVIGYDEIKMDAYEITNVIGYDEFKNAIINFDLNTVNERLFDSYTLKYSDRNK